MGPVSGVEGAGGLEVFWPRGQTGIPGMDIGLDSVKIRVNLLPPEQFLKAGILTPTLG